MKSCNILRSLHRSAKFIHVHIYSNYIVPKSTHFVHFGQGDIMLLENKIDQNRFSKQFIENYIMWSFLAVSFLCKKSGQSVIILMSVDSFYCTTSRVLHIDSDTRYATCRFQSIYSDKTNTHHYKNIDTCYSLNTRDNRRKRIAWWLPQVWR